MHIASLELHPERFPAANCYPFTLAVFRRTPSVAFPTNITFFSGDNGSGKSTLLRAMSRGCGVHIWQETSIDRVNPNPHEHHLYRYTTLHWTAGPKPGAFFSSESYDHMSRMIEEWASTDPSLLEYFGGRSLLTQSHGESYMAFFSSRYTREGVYFLDEPETALSPRRQLLFVRLLRAMAQDGHAQFFVATHSPILLACPGATILSFDGETITPVAYEQTEYFRVYREFLADRSRFL